MQQKILYDYFCIGEHFKRKWQNFEDLCNVFMYRNRKLMQLEDYQAINENIYVLDIKMYG